jgi:fatty-acyl-CoA synthase
MELTDKTLGQFLELWAEKTPDKDFMVYPDRDLRFSYAGFNQRVDNMAKALLEIGMKPGDKLGVWANNVPDWLTFMFATAKIGVVLVTINTNYRLHELEYLLKNSDIKSLCLVNGFRDSDYVNMVYELIPELRECERGNLKSEKFPLLENLIFYRAPRSTGECTHPQSCCFWVPSLTMMSLIRPSPKLAVKMWLICNTPVVPQDFQKE